MQSSRNSGVTHGVTHRCKPSEHANNPNSLAEHVHDSDNEITSVPLLVDVMLTLSAVVALPSTFDAKPRFRPLSGYLCDADEDQEAIELLIGRGKCQTRLDGASDNDLKSMGSTSSLSGADGRQVNWLGHSSRPHVSTFVLRRRDSVSGSQHHPFACASSAGAQAVVDQVREASADPAMHLQALEHIL